MGERIHVLRLGHRMGRDPRITTHLALVARAMGADRFLLGGDEDQKMFDNVRSVEARFGQAMALEYLASPMGWLRTFSQKDAGDGRPGTVVHLTMYGIPHRQAIPQIRRDRPLAVVVGGAKVPAEAFSLAHHNVSVGQQPHSEVAALALFLDAWTDGAGLDRTFDAPKLVIHPSARGKNVTEEE
ncbi:MAG TPA: tRNA (cytidine(56)-2'-O)-methyltransferase [Candidatus Poseidoniaceae archaeon]|nr:MAG: tRNA (cytidine(56)-2'-O)-methyltransferase [Euryarchaeota archaeon TMED141]DAC07953.1 MAG TPA: tRNA (cytidine(56)-2'-O)-methyltransferase [Candidatus Poseidoniales archaeon]DAC15276.1 MAG TPA: tRNA (cytidine(56)-2'-O)-methyltransferase [Candidatus Poseidoniales archaeon]HII19445.1 tRNA (cytidine(56)-2'-O)-methyltransferase [Candidatus Poseidoniaceae archaeon]HII97601.1 tRNA (cytidine(56)-2'-O)-methyltransferase [Candidatus Poseidoniaceae archaeon]